jgi:hypothetical protein
MASPAPPRPRSQRVFPEPDLWHAAAPRLYPDRGSAGDDGSAPGPGRPDDTVNQLSDPERWGTLPARPRVEAPEGCPTGWAHVLDRYPRRAGGVAGVCVARDSGTEASRLVNMYAARGSRLGGKDRDT